MSLALTTAPTVEPVSLDDFRAWLGWTSADDNNAMQELLYAARHYVESILWRQLITATWTWKLDRFEPVLLPPRPPLLAVTSINYIDGDGDSTLLASTVYQVVTGEDSRIVEAYDQSWPETRLQPEAVTIVYTAGYGTNGHDVPEPIRHAILMTAGHWWLNRGCGEMVMPVAARAMIEAFRALDTRRLLGV